MKILQSTWAAILLLMLSCNFYDQAECIRAKTKLKYIQDHRKNLKDLKNRKQIKKKKFKIIDGQLKKEEIITNKEVKGCTK